MLKKDNQGVTLIELIIIMLIIGILAGGAFIGVRSIDSADTKSTVQRINALLDYVRVENMSKNITYYLVIKQEDNHFVANIQYNDGVRKNILTDELRLNNGSITYINSMGTIFTVSDEKFLEISFSKDAGNIQSGIDGDIKSIIVSAGGHSYTIHLVKATGKHYIEG